jgi:hypothetical protein
LEKVLMKHLVRGFLLMVLAAGVGQSQQLATLSVTVVDPSGKLIAGAGVSLSDANTGLTRNAQTNRAGLAVLTAVAAGDYELTVKANGFSLWKHALTLTVGQTASIPVQMRVAAVKESVTVSSTGVQGIDTEKTEASDVIQPSQIDNLPISDRDFIDFVLLTPNANVGRSTATASQSAFQETVLELSFDGLRETRSTAFLLDGTDYTMTISGVQRESRLRNQARTTCTDRPMSISGTQQPMPTTRSPIRDSMRCASISSAPTLAGRFAAIRPSISPDTKASARRSRQFIPPSFSGASIRPGVWDRGHRASIR